MKKAKKFDSGKVSFSDLPRLGLWETAKVMNYGRQKYAKFNYSGKVEVTRLTDALERHLNQYLTGIDIDESKCHHVAHIAANALMLMDAISTGQAIDNRNKVYKLKKK
jgi:hypothetical protein